MDEETRKEDITPFKIEFESCPVQASLGILGRKYALLIIRNIGLFGKQRFNEMLKVTLGLTKRVLSMRLKELERGGFIEVGEKGLNYSKWYLTPRESRPARRPGAADGGAAAYRDAWPVSRAHSGEGWTAA